MSKFNKSTSKKRHSRVVIRQHVPWHLRLFFAIIFCVFLVLLAWGMYEFGSKSGGNRPVIVKPEPIDTTKLYEIGVCQKQDRAELCTQLAGLKRQLQISNTTSENLTKQVKVLGEENNQMKEELDFLQHLMSGKMEFESGLSIYHLGLKKTAEPGVYRYTITLVQSGQRPTDFNGNLKLLVNLKRDGKSTSVPLANKSSENGFPVSFKFFHKIQENFRIPADAVVESLQVDVFKEDDATAILTQTIEPSS